MVRKVWVGGGLLAASVGCSAMSLGAVQGQALIGRPLDVVVPLVLAEGESATDACASAQVFFADDAVSSGNVKTAVVTSAATKATLIRVQTSVPLPEPFVRIELQAGCGQRLARSYVLLADLPPVVSAAVALPKAPAPIQPPTSVAPQVAEPLLTKTASTGLAIGESPANQSASNVARKHSRASQRNEKPTSSRRVAATAGAPVQAGSRLTLDPIELMAAVNQMQPALRMSIEAPQESAVNEDLEQRRQAARLLWKALNESPEQLAANALKAQVDTNAETTSIKAALVAAQQAEQVAQAQLTEEREGRYTDPVFLALFAALVAALAGLGAVWHRHRNLDRSAQDAPSSVWTRQPRTKAKPSEADSLPQAGWREALKDRFFRKPTGLNFSESVKEGDSILDIDVETLLPEDKWPPPKKPDLARTEVRQAQLHSDFGHSALFEGARSVATEELFDLQQQVEFFISLGQADQAIEVLKAHLADSDDSSPLAYLDLLQLYHELNHREDYDALRDSFNERFNGNAPSFDRYSTSRRGLQRYEAALSRIQALWPQPEVLHLIERSIFRSHPDDVSEVFDLEAYRELLLLYGIAREVIENQSPGPVQADRAPAQDRSTVGDSVFGHTAMQPLPATMGQALGTAPASAAFIASVPPAPAADDPFDDGADLTLPIGAADAPSAFVDLGPDLDLDLSLADEPSSDDALADVGQPPNAPDGAGALLDAGATPQSAQISPGLHVLDLDFSDLGEPENFTIKKSGTPD